MAEKKETKRIIATVGDAADINCWSGTPFHFWQAGLNAGWNVEPCRLPLNRFSWSRRIWNARRWCLGQGIGGYQYSDAFADRAAKLIGFQDLPGAHVISFNQHFPRPALIATHGGILSHYLDATFPLLLTRYGFDLSLPREIQKMALEKEREAFQAAKWLVFFQRWSAESAIRDCGADPKKVRVICPGANIVIHDEVALCPRISRPFVLGFVGKDWRRKGLLFLLKVRQQLEVLGTPAVVRCVGCAPSELASEKGVEFLGFIDKRREHIKFVEFLRSCDLGCLFSTAEASSIAVLEFLRAGVPTTGFTVDGMADLFPPDAALRFEPTTAADEVAEAIHLLAQEEGRYEAMRSAARDWSRLVTWERCVAEWDELMKTGNIAQPVRPWLGLKAQEAIYGKPGRAP